MKGNAVRFGWSSVGVLCLLTVGWVLAGSAGTPVLEGLPTDWTHRHVIFSQPVTATQARLMADEPRFWQQEFRRSALRVVADSRGAPEGVNSLGLAFRGVSEASVHRDWSQDMGPSASAVAGTYPAKYGFQATTAKCVTGPQPDFVVFSTGVFGQPTQADIIAYDNLYSGCTGTVPRVYWAYNLNGGRIPTSPVFSQDGAQIAFTGTDGTSAHFVMLTWAASTTETASSPMLLLPSGLNSYPGCGGAPPCFASLPFLDGTGAATNDTTSSVFYDYGADIAWVGDSGGWLHQFHPVFNGVPAEIRNTIWPVHVNPGSPTPLSSPAHDRVSGNIFVGDLGGFLYHVNTGTGAVTISARLDSGPTGIVAGPIVDSTAGFVYAFASNDGTSGAQPCGTGPCSAVYVLPVGFAGGATGNKAVVGASSATPQPMYDGGFDSTYLSSNNGTGKLRVCGNTGGAPTLYQIGVSLGAWFGVTTGPTLASAATGCSPVTDVLNPNIAGGATEWVFASVGNSGSGNSCASGGCLMNFRDQPWQPATAHTLGQQIVDNQFQVEVVSKAGTSKTGGPPSWGTTVGSITIDGTARWINQGPQVAAHATWLPTHAYTAGTGTEIIDSNNNIQWVITTGVSKVGTHPTWNVNVNGNTTDGSVKWRNVGSVATASFAAAGGTSGIVIDNTVGSGTLAGASQAYFSTQGSQACGTSGTGGCAVQASQSALK